MMNRATLFRKLRMRGIFALLLLVIAATVGWAQPKPLPPGDSPPPTVFDRVTKAGTAKDFKDAAYVIVLDSTVNRISELGICYTDSYILYKVLTEEGCRNLSVITRGYEPLSSYVEFRRVNIIRGDSTIPVSIAGAKDLPAPQSAIYWGDRLKMLQLPRLHVGDGIEIEVFRKGYSYALLDGPQAEPDDERYIPPMPGEYFDIVLFEAAVPMVEKKYVLKLPAAKRLHSRIYNGPMFSATTYNTDTTTYTWWIADVPAHAHEPYTPDESDLVAKVVIATVESWEAKSRWFFEVNEPQFAVTDAIKAKVDEILAKAGVQDGTEEQKAFELVHWVAQNIRYSGQTMGKGEGYTLHSGAMIFEQRSGVCKDIAGMLITMMRAAGLDSHGAMTMAGSRIEEVPADQFNHCVVALKKPDGSFVMYDPTWVPYYKDIWSKLETEQHYLVGSPEGEPLNRIPYSPPSESPLKVTNTGRILPDGSLEATMELRSDGSIDTRLRRFYSRTRRAEQAVFLAGILRLVSDRVDILDYAHGDVRDFNHAMWWRIQYRVPQYALPVADGWEFKSPMMQVTTGSTLLFPPAAIDWAEKREDDMMLWTTQRLDGREEIELPTGFRLVKPPESKGVDETYALFKGTSQAVKGKLVITQEGELRRRQIPPDGYPGMRKAFQEAREYAGKVFRFEKGGAR